MSINMPLLLQFLLLGILEAHPSLSRIRKEDSKSEAIALTYLT